MGNTAERLKEALSIRNMKQSELAARTGIGKSSISTYLSGAYVPKQKNIYKMAQVLDVSEAWLMGLDVPMEKLERLQLNEAKRKLSLLVSSDASMLSGKRVEFLFNSMDYDPMIISYSLDIDQRYIDGWIDNNDLPPQPIVDKILGLFQMKASELLNGEELVSYMEENVEWGKTPSNIFKMPDTYQVPMVGTIACGQPIQAIEEVEETVAVPNWIRADFALRCKGDSMINARIFDGDIVYIRKQPDVENGEIAAVRIGDEATLKKVYHNEKRIILRAANPLFPDMEYEGVQLAEIEILGKAVAFTSMLN